MQLLVAASHCIMLNHQHVKSPFEFARYDLARDFIDLNITLLERLFNEIVLLPPYEFKIIVCASMQLLAQNIDEDVALGPEFESYFKRIVKVVVRLLAYHPHISQCISKDYKEPPV